MSTKNKEYYYKLLDQQTNGSLAEKPLSADEM
jgi:hypothetical protein